MIVRGWGVKNEKGRGLGWKKMKKVEILQKVGFSQGQNKAKTHFQGVKGLNQGKSIENIAKNDEKWSKSGCSVQSTPLGKMTLFEQKMESRSGGILDAILSTFLSLFSFFYFFYFFHFFQFFFSKISAFYFFGIKVSIQFTFFYFFYSIVRDWDKKRMRK